MICFIILKHVQSSFRSRSNNDLLSIENADSAILHSLPVDSSIPSLEKSTSNENNMSASLTSSPIASPTHQGMWFNYSIFLGKQGAMVRSNEKYESQVLKCCCNVYSMNLNFNSNFQFSRHNVDFVVVFECLGLTFFQIGWELETSATTA